jgi:hypothetical protein
LLWRLAAHRPPSLRATVNSLSKTYRPAPYTLTVFAAQFAPHTFDHVTVTAGSVYTLPVKLSLRQESRSIEVSAAELPVDVTTTTQTTTIPSTVVQDLPLNGRDFTQLVALTPGYSGYSAGGFGSLNGTRANQMNWQIEGADNNDIWHNIPAVNQGGISGIAGIVLPLDAIDEFSTQAQSNAEAGRNPGGIINLVVKSGSNSLHGSAYYYNRNEFYSAASPFLPPRERKPKMRNENWGGTLGGPILKNRTFFFLGYEKQDFVIGQQGLTTEPSFAWQGLALAQLDKFHVPVNPLSATLMANLWPGNALTGTAVANNFFSSAPNTGYSHNGIVKLDHTFSDNHKLSAHWFAGDGIPIGAAGSSLLWYYEVGPIHVQNYSLVLNSTFTRKLTNQALFGANYLNNVFHDFNQSFDSRALGLFLSPQTNLHGAPNIVIAGFDQIGVTPPMGRNDITGHLADSLSYTEGKHQFRFGGEVRQSRVDVFYFRHSLGSFVFDGSIGPWAETVSGNTAALADFLAGYVREAFILVGNAERQVIVNGFSLFGQDAWQLTRKLHLNFGLRYEYAGPLHNGDRNLANFDPSGGGLLVQGAGIRSLYPGDWNNLAPRFGFAYQPKENGGLVVRGGFGVFYDQINLNPFLDYRSPNGGANGFISNPAGAAPVSTYSRNDPFTWRPNSFIFPAATTCTTGNGCGDALFDVFSVSRRFRTPYFYNYNLNLEKSFGTSIVAQVGYAGSQGRKLNTMLDLNQASLADPNNPATPPLQQRRPLASKFSNFASVNTIETAGTSNYNSLQVTLKMRSWRHLTSQFAYTWSHALDEMSAYRDAMTQNNFDLKQDYGNGDFDTRHSLAAYLAYEIPGSRHGPRWLTHDWQLVGLLSFHTGQPFNIINVPDTTGTDEGQQHVQQVGDPFVGISQAGVQWVNPAACARQVRLDAP